MEKLKLSYFWNTMRKQGSLGKTVMLGKIEGRRERGRQNIRWVDVIKDARGMMSPLELGSVSRAGPCEHHSEGCRVSEPTQRHVTYTNIYS